MTWKRVFGLTYGEATWIVAAVYLLTYELWAVFTRDGDVLTRAYRANAPRWTVFALGVGILMGHLHGPLLGSSGVFGKWSPAAFIVCGVVALARDVFVGGRVAEAMVLPLFLFGVGLGALSWAGRP